MPGSPLAYNESDLLRLRDLLEKKTGLYILDDKLNRLEEPFRDLCGTLPAVLPRDIIRAIEAGDQDGLGYLDTLVAAVATNETYFFRIPAHFDTLKDYLLPEIVERKKSRGERALKIWSAGCSTGEEPYSIAILLLEHFPELLSWQVDILATDIDLDALARAGEGIYRPWSFRGVMPELIRKYWSPLKGERYRIDDRARALVRFSPLNLESDTYPSAVNGTSDLDIIVCRNVTIYFRPHTIRKILQRFHDGLIEGGFLLTGAAEYSREAYLDFEARVFPETVIYQKPSAKAAAPAVKPVPWVRRAPLPRPSPRPVEPTAKKVEAAAPPVAEDLLAKTVELISRGELDTALVLLAGLAEKTPKDSRVCFLLGQLAADRQHLAEAAYWLSRTIALDPLNLWAHYSMALLWMDEGKLDEALGAIKKTIYIDANFALGHFYLGKIHRTQGRTAQARRSFAAAKSLLASASLSENLPGADGITGRQLLMLLDRELADEG
jgi:chemotaxis protein methyltransferase CheR